MLVINKWLLDIDFIVYSVIFIYHITIAINGDMQAEIVDKYGEMDNQTGV
jgi:hypothetical protein